MSPPPNMRQPDPYKAAQTDKTKERRRLLDPCQIALCKPGLPYNSGPALDKQTASLNEIYKAFLYRMIDTCIHCRDLSRAFGSVLLLKDVEKCPQESIEYSFGGL